MSSDHDVPFYAEAFGIPESNVVPIGIPRMDRFFDERTAGRRPGVRAGHIPDDRRPSGLALRADLSRRGPSRDLRHGPDRPRRTPRAGRGARRRGHLQDASVRARPRADPRGLRRPPRRRDADQAGRQRPAVRGGPADHRLLVDRVRVLRPGATDAVLRLRPRRVHRRTRLLRSVRGLRAGAHRAHLSTSCSTPSGATTTTSRRSAPSWRPISRTSTDTRRTGSSTS